MRESCCCHVTWRGLSFEYFVCKGRGTAIYELIETKFLCLYISILFSLGEEKFAAETTSLSMLPILLGNKKGSWELSSDHQLKNLFLKNAKEVSCM